MDLDWVHTLCVSIMPIVCMQSIAKLLLAKPPVTNWKHLGEEQENSKTQLRGCVVPAWSTRGNPKFCRGNPKLCRGNPKLCRGPRNPQNPHNIIRNLIWLLKDGFFFDVVDILGNMMVQFWDFHGKVCIFVDLWLFWENAWYLDYSLMHWPRCKGLHVSSGEKCSMKMKKSSSLGWLNFKRQNDLIFRNITCFELARGII